MATKKKSTAAAGKGDDRQKALDAAMAMIEKDFGKGAVMRLGDDERPPIRAISSGNTAIDIALGIGGFPRGRIVEIYGPESSGKTTVALHAIASASAPAESPRLLTPNTPWTPTTPANSAWIPTTS